MKFKIELSEKSKDSEFSDILEHEDEIRPLVDKGLSVEQAYYAVNHNRVQNTNREIEKKVEAKLQNNQTRKEILQNINSNDIVILSGNIPKCINENIYETIKINHFILYFVFVGNCEGYGGTIGVIGYTYGKN